MSLLCTGWFSCGGEATPSYSMWAPFGSGLSCCGAWTSRLLGPVEDIFKIFLLMHEYRIFFFSVFSFFIDAL